MLFLVFENDEKAKVDEWVVKICTTLSEMTSDLGEMNEGGGGSDLEISVSFSKETWDLILKYFTYLKSCDRPPKGELDLWEPMFFAQDPSAILDVIKAVDFLGATQIYERCCTALAMSIETRTPEDLGIDFGEHDGLTDAQKTSILTWDDDLKEKSWQPCEKKKGDEEDDDNDED